jgi:aspartate aminotransferase, mitochondrial
MSTRISQNCIALVETLVEVGSIQNWTHITTSQIGMFAFTGLTEDQVDILTSKYSLYMTRDGRISLAGLNPSNIRYVAQAIHDVTSGTTPKSSE